MAPWPSGQLVLGEDLQRAHQRRVVALGQTVRRAGLHHGLEALVVDSILTGEYDSELPSRIAATLLSVSPGRTAAGGASAPATALGKGSTARPGAADSSCADASMSQSACSGRSASGRGARTLRLGRRHHHRSHRRRRGGCY